MFCVLLVKEREDTLLERLFGKLRRDDYSLKTVAVFRGAPFYVLTASVGKKGPDWGIIEETAGKCASRLVCEKGAAPQGRIGLFKSTALLRKITENTFLKLLGQSGFEKHKKSICITAGNQDSAFVRKAAPFASRLTVAVGDKEKYAAVCEEILCDTGLSVSLLFEPVNAEITIDLISLVMKIRTENAFYTVSPGGDFTVPEIYEKLLPENVDKYDFFSALYELCGVFSLEECIFTEVEVNNEKKSADTVCFT